jgi:hypothetical protein
MSQPNIKYYQLDGEAFEVPRDPSAYRATDHFVMRCKDRVPDTRQDRYIRETIKRGEVSGTAPTQSPSTVFDVVQHFKFRQQFEHWDCEIIVGIRPVAHNVEDKKHLALTIYNPEDHE